MIAFARECGVRFYVGILAWRYNFGEWELAE